ncbi:hypothetical protein KSS87_020113 [Heliosperma pusillum]|nr:hypothetical protein KSS87_020113 [Heliosperma pusillum]
METLTQIRNDLLQKLKKEKGLEFRSLVVCSNSKLKRAKTSHKIRTGDRLESRLALRETIVNCQESDSSEKQNSGSEKQKKADDSSKKENKTNDSLYKLNNKNGSSENQNLISLYKQQKKISVLSKKPKTSANLSSNPQKDNGKLENECLKRNQKIKRKNDKVIRDEASHLQRKARYLLVKLKLEQNLIDAYTGEGWKGQSREKIKPEKELQRAKKQILNYKLGIRDTVRQLDLLGSVGKIDDTFISSDGSVHHDHIICKNCKSQEVSEDNDIILCDGTCNCGFHQKCIDPPLATEDIPPEDVGWLCKYCDCKTDLLEAMNAHLGTEFTDDCMWQDIFKEEALLSESGMRDFNPNEEWPDDESDDNDYHPDVDDIYSTRNSDARDDSCSHEESSSSSSNCSLESEAHWESGLSTESNEISSDVPLLRQNCVIDSNDHVIVSGPRQRPAVDYKKLYDEMFAKDISNTEVCSDDEDWDPCKRRRREKESDAASTLMKLSGSEGKPSDSQSQEVGKDHPSDNKPKKPHSKIPYDVLQKLRQTFAENELPSRDVKKDISEAVGIEYAKVNKWFKNSRYLALKKRKRQSSLHCPASDKSDIEVSEDVKGTISECSSPISIHKKQLKKVSWNDNLITLIRSEKKKRLKKTSHANTKENEDLSDDVSLKKHLLCLKAKSRQTKGGRPDIEHPPVESAEMQMEKLWQIEAKLWKLKQIVSTFQKATLRDSIEQSVDEKHVVYVPIAEVKEKL